MYNATADLARGETGIAFTFLLLVSLCQFLPVKLRKLPTTLVPPSSSTSRADSLFAGRLVLVLVAFNATPFRRIGVRYCCGLGRAAWCRCSLGRGSRLSSGSTRPDRGVGRPWLDVALTRHS